MQNYLSILEDLKEETEKTRKRSWKWLLFWRKTKPRKAQNLVDDPEQEILLGQNGPNQPGTPSKDVPELVMARRYSTWNIAKQETGAKQGLYRQMLHIARFLERDDGWFLPLNRLLLIDF